METLFKKYFKVVQAGFVVVVALLLAAALTSFGASFLAPLAVTVPDGGDDGVASGEEEETFIADLPPGLFGFAEDEPPPDPCAEVECDEGMICDAATGECVPEPEPEPEDEETELADGRCIESDIAINLVGTQVAEDPAWSLAILHNPAIDRTQFAVIGTTLLAEAEVTRIERNRVFMQRNGREECLRYGEASERAQRAQGSNTSTTSPRVATTTRQTATTATASPNTAPQGQGSAQPDTLEGRMQAGIRRNRDGTYDVQRDLIAEIANNQEVMEQQAPRVTPNYVNGQPRGFRLQGIRSGSMFSRIGIRNGDVIVAVGDTQIDSPQRALELYDQMMQRANVEVTVLRRGREHTINYNIR